MVYLVHCNKTLMQSLFPQLTAIIHVLMTQQLIIFLIYQIHHNILVGVQKQLILVKSGYKSLLHKNRFSHKFKLLAEVMENQMI